MHVSRLLSVLAKVGLKERWVARHVGRKTWATLAQEAGLSHLQISAVARHREDARGALHFPARRQRAAANEPRRRAAGGEALDFCRSLERSLSDGVQKWIPTNERKPNDEQMVLAFWPGSSYARDSFASVTFHASDSDVDGHDAWLDVFGNSEDEPTHWMPLPEAPK
jgi:hypothetical protein